jgi:hypothetical protein
MAALAAARRPALGTIDVLLLLAPLVLVPLGSALVGRSFGEGTPLGPVARALLPFAAIPAALSFWVPRGQAAGLLAAGWPLACGLAALDGLRRPFRRGSGTAVGACLAGSSIYLLVGGVWLVLSRLGVAPRNLPEQIVLLAALHFHYTGFVLPVVAAATGRALGERAPGAEPASGSVFFPAVVAGILCGPALLAAGNLLALPLLKLAGALLLAAASMGLVVLLVPLLPRVTPGIARVLLGVSAIALVAGMSLVAVYAVGEFTTRTWLAVPQMAYLHGTINAVGFALCGLLGWTLAGEGSRTAA